VPEAPDILFVSCRPWQATGVIALAGITAWALSSGLVGNSHLFKKTEWLEKFYVRR